MRFVTELNAKLCHLMCVGIIAVGRPSYMIHWLSHCESLGTYVGGSLGTCVGESLDTCVGESLDTCTQ